MRNKRSSIRKRPNESVPIIDINAGHTLGYLANISMGGLMLIGQTPSAPGTLFQLQMPLPTPIQGVNTIEFGVESLWCQRTRDTCSYWTGFQIIDLSDSASNTIEALISDWQ